MTLQQQAVSAIECLPEEKLSQVIQFAKFLSAEPNPRISAEHRVMNGEGYIRKPGILKRKMVMSDDFDEAPEGFEEYI